MKDIKLVVSDIDGTLVNSKKEVPYENIKAVNKLMEKGILFAVATGRNFHELGSVYSAFTKKIPAAVLNGGFIADHNGSKIKSSPLEYSLIKKIQKILDAEGFYYELMDENTVYSSSKSVRRKLLAKRFELPLDSQEVKKTKTYSRTRFVDFNHIHDYTEEIQKICIFDVHEKGFGDLSIFLKKSIEGEVTSSHIDNIEINAKGVHKGSGIAVLAEHYNISMDQILAFGDNLNDISMLECAGFFCAMENSHPYILENSKYRTVSNNDCGVAKAFESFGLI